MSARPRDAATDGRALPRTPATADPLEMAIHAHQHRSAEMLGAGMSKIQSGLAALRAENEQLRAEAALLHRLIDRLA